MATSAFAKQNPVFLKIISIICACLVPLLVTGPFLPDLVVSSLSLWFVYYTLKNKIYNIYQNIYFYFFIGFWAVCILSSLLSSDILLSIKASLFYVRIGVFALLISYLIDQNKKILDYFYYAFLITFTALIIDGYFQYFTGSNMFGYKIHGMRVSSFFGKELILGSYLARLFPLLFALFVARVNKHFLEIYFVSVLFILIDLLIFLAGERASFIFLNISTIFIILFIKQHKWLRLGLFILSFIIITFLTLNSPKLFERYVQSPIDSMGLDGKEKYFFTESHDFLFRTAWNMFLDKPILGHGPKLFRIKCEEPKYAQKIIFNCHPHPHNFYIQLLAETGIIGFSFLAGLFIYFIYLTFRHVKEYFKYKRAWFTDYQVCLLAGLLITIWPFSTNGNIFTNNLMLFYGLQMGFFRRNIN